jgi:hypothetical protein
MNKEIEAWIKTCEERCEKATESPWEVEDYRDAGDWRSTGIVWQKNLYGGLGHRICQVNCDKLSSVSPKEQISEFETNAEFISHSRTDLPKALKALKLAVEALEYYQKTFPKLEGIARISREALAAINEVIK